MCCGGGTNVLVVVNFHDQQRMAVVLSFTDRTQDSGNLALCFLAILTRDFEARLDAVYM